METSCTIKKYFVWKKFKNTI